MRSMIPLLALAAGCELDPKDPADATGDTGETSPIVDPPDTSPPPPPVTGDGVLRFEVVWGSGAGQQYQGSTWQAIIDTNLFSPTEVAYRDHVVLLMLCETTDPTCTAPIVVREVGAAETSGDPIQGSFGPDIELADLPEGDFLAMVIADSGISRAKGFAHDDAFGTSERAWGGIVSEFDVMLNDPADPPSAQHNPPPAPLPVTITAAGTDLGTLALQHVHERDISPPLPAETGKIVVAVEGGLRIVDLATYAVEPAEGFASSTYAMLDPSLSVVDGEVCGMIEGTNGAVWVLFQRAGADGFAVPFDPVGRAQMADYHRVTFPGGDSPCRGIAAEIDGDETLIVTNAPASRLNEPEAQGSEGVWVANVAGIEASDLAAVRSDRLTDPVLEVAVSDIAVVGEDLFLSVSADPYTNAVPPACNGTHCLFRASVGGTGSIVIDDYLPVLPQADGTTNDVQTVDCTGSGPWAGVEAARFHDDRSLVFVGGCTQIAAVDTDTFSLVDFDDSLIGQQNLDATLFGQGFNSFSPSPDGATLWALPAAKSPVHFYIRKGHEGDDRQTFNRMMALPIDLSSGAVPGVSAAFAGGDLDGHEGLTNIGPYLTPADDPGVDINFATQVVHQMFWLPSTAGSTFQSASFPIGPEVVATNATLWVRGSGVPGVSGLGKSGNLAVYDLATRSPLLFPYADDQDFYPYWLGGPGGDETLGFDLTPEGPDILATRGMIYLP